MTKRAKKLIALLLLAVLCVSTPISAMASTQICTANLFQAGSFDINYDRDYSKYQSTGLNLGIQTLDVNMTDDEVKFEDRIYQALLKHQSAINFYLTDKLSAAWCKTMYTDVINDHPELFYVSQTYATTTTFGVITCITPYYTMESAEIDAAKATFDAGVNKVLALVDNSMSDLQKALVIHDYICSNAVYQDNGIVSHSAWGFFKDGYIVCAGYALVYSYIMNKAGVECELITSATHGWNTIKIDGKWYNVDLTWDDITIASEPWINDSAVQHIYFMKSDTVFNTHHEESDTFDDCVRSDTSYDSGMFWEDVYNSIMVNDGKYYYLDPQFSLLKVYVVERTQSGTERRLGSFSTYYNSYTNATRLYAALAKLDNKLFVAYKSGIASLTYAGKSSLVASIDTSTIVGLSVKDNELMYCNKGKSGYTVLKKSDYYNKNNVSTGKTDVYGNQSHYNGYVDINADGYVNAKDYVLLKKQGKI